MVVKNDSMSYLIGRVSGRVATAVAVAGRRLDDDFRLDDNFVRRSPRRRLLGDGRQRQVGAAQSTRNVRRTVVVVVVAAAVDAALARLRTESGPAGISASRTPFHAR